MDLQFVTIAASVAGALIAVGAHLRPRHDGAPPALAPAPAPRETPPPAPAPQPSHPGLFPLVNAAELDALRREHDARFASIVEALEHERSERRAEAARAQAFREEMIATMATIKERVRTSTPLTARGTRGGLDG